MRHATIDDVRRYIAHVYETGNPEGEMGGSMFTDTGEILPLGTPVFVVGGVTASSGILKGKQIGTIRERDLTPESLFEAVKFHAAVTIGHPHRIITGVWVDRNDTDSRWYIDASEVHADYRTAMAVAVARAERAIWDNARVQSIYTGLDNDGTVADADAYARAVAVIRGVA